MKNIEQLRLLKEEEFANYVESVFLSGMLYQDYLTNLNSIFSGEEFNMEDYIKWLNKEVE